MASEKRMAVRTYRAPRKQVGTAQVLSQLRDPNQTDRVRRQIRALRLFGSIDAWREVAG